MKQMPAATDFVQTGRRRHGMSNGGGNSRQRSGLAALASLLALVACGGGDSDPQRPTAREKAQAIATPDKSQWSGLVPLTLVPAAAANLPNGKVVLWSAETRFSFSAGGPTYTTISIPQPA